MKKLINNPKNVVHEMLRGATQSHPELKKLHDLNSVVYEKNKRNVILLSGGGSGHEPLDLGYVGEELLDGAIIGEPFTPPSAEQIVKTTEFFGNEKDILFVVKNFNEDCKQFEKAINDLKIKKIKAKIIIVSDDVSINPETKEARKRGVAGAVIMHKILGAAANHGLNIDELINLGNEINNNLFTLGVALTGAELPMETSTSFELEEDQIFYGIGIHGESGYRSEKLVSSELLGRELVNKLVQTGSITNKDEIVVLINGLGSLPTMDSFIFTNDVTKLLSLKGIVPTMIKTGNFLSSYNMNGVSLTILKVKSDSWIEYLNANCGGFGWY